MSSTVTTTTSPGEDPGQQLRNRFSKAEQTARVEEYRAERQKLQRFTFTSTQSGPGPVFRSIITMDRTLQKVQQPDSIDRTVGIDTIGVFIDETEYTLAEDHGIPLTNEQYEEPYGISVHPDGSAYVNINVSIVQDGPAKSVQEVQSVVDKANHWLKRTGITTSLCAAKLSRLDLAVTAHMPRKYSAYTPIISGCSLPRTTPGTSKDTHYWKTQRRDLTVYDKGAKETSRTISTDLVRFELRLKKHTEVKKRTGCSTLLDFYAAPERAVAAYNAQVEALLPEPCPAIETDAEPGEALNLIIELLSEMKGTRSPVKKLLQAKALADLDSQAEGHLLNAVSDTLGRSKRSRVKRQIKKMQPLTETFRQPHNQTAERVEELRNAFILAASE